MDETRNIINIAVALLGLGGVVLLIVAVWLNRFDPVLTQLVVRNFAAIIGLPFAFLAAFAIVALFRQTEGPVEFEGLGLKFKGASGQIILWMICFSAIAANIKLLWKD